jgi:hypothetical protein
MPLLGVAEGESAVVSMVLANGLAANPSQASHALSGGGGGRRGARGYYLHS